MRRVRLPLLLLGIVLGLAGLAAAPQGCRACSCAPLKSPVEARASAAAVFQGQVVAIMEERDAQGFPRQRVTMRATTSWQGDVPAEVAIYTGMGDADCGLRFQPGSDYLIYAYSGRGSLDGAVGTLNTGLCNRTRPLADAAGDLIALGPGQPITAGPNTAGSAGSVPVPGRFGAVLVSPLLLALLCVALAILLAFPLLLLRLRR